LHISLWPDNILVTQLLVSAILRAVRSEEQKDMQRAQNLGVLTYQLLGMLSCLTPSWAAAEDWKQIDRNAMNDTLWVDMDSEPDAISFKFVCGLWARQAPSINGESKQSR
jgi:hypothetical protein